MSGSWRRSAASRRNTNERYGRYTRERGFEERSLQTILKDMDVEKIEVVRIDTEGAEWEALFQF